MRAYPSLRSLTYGGSGGISSAAVDWTEPREHQPVDSAGIETCVDGRATGAPTSITAACVPGGARPGRTSDVPQGAGVPSHSLAVGRTVADATVGLSQSEGRRGRPRSHANVAGLSGNPVRAERAERRRTPRVTAESAIRVHRGTMDSSNPQDPRPESGNQGGAQAELRREWKFSQGGCTNSRIPMLVSRVGVCRCNLTVILWNIVQDHVVGMRTASQELSPIRLRRRRRGRKCEGPPLVDYCPPPYSMVTHHHE